MLALRYLQWEESLAKKEPTVLRAEPKKKKDRLTCKRRTSTEMMHSWNLGKRGQQSLKHEIPIPKEGIHTVRAVPQVIRSLINKKDPSLCVIAKWTNQYYESNNLNIQLIIDGDI